MCSWNRPMERNWSWTWWFWVRCWGASSQRPASRIIHIFVVSFSVSLACVLQCLGAKSMSPGWKGSPPHAADHLQSWLADVEWSVAVLDPLEVNNYLLCFVPIQDQVFGCAPACQLLKFVSSGLVIVDCNFELSANFITLLVVSNFGYAVVCQQRDQRGTQNKVLKWACAKIK